MLKLKAHVCKLQSKETQRSHIQTDKGREQYQDVDGHKTMKDLKLRTCMTIILNRFLVSMPKIRDCFQN